MKCKVLLLFSISFIFFSAKSQIIEDFSNTSLYTTYSTGTFIGVDSIIWNFANARGGQTTNTNRNAAISLNKAITASIYTDTLALGLKHIKFQWEQELSSNCNASVFINDSCVAILTSTSSADSTQICEIDSIYFDMPVVFKIVQNASNSGQITIDDIEFTYVLRPYMPLHINVLHNQDSLVEFSVSKPLQNIQIQSIPSDAMLSYVTNNQNIEVICNPLFCGNYKLIMSEIVDMDSIPENSIEFDLQKTSFPKWQSILVTEIMADPSPIVGLPEQEYIEIYNNTDCDIRGTNVIIEINSIEFNLPDSIIHPNSYYIISESNFRNSINNIVVSDLPSLLNEGTTIVVKNSKDEIVSHVSYSDSWYSSNFKENGGWSLEKIDNENYCEDSSNWRASICSLGGTPGNVNSISYTNVDTIPPKLIEGYPKNDSILYLKVSENCNPIQINGFIQIPSITCTVDNYSLREFEYKLYPKLERDTLYLCTIQFQDIAGNLSNIYTQYIGLPIESIHRNSVQFNEILYDPLPGKYDFIEFYNNSDQIIDCSKLYVAGYDEFSKDYSPIIRITENPILLQPYGYLVITESLNDINIYSICEDNSQYIEVSELPSMPDDKGMIVLLNSLGGVVDSLMYFDNWHSPSIANTEGISLERISHGNTKQLSDNWYSSSTVNQTASPGCENSQYSIESESEIRINSELITPNNDGENDFFEMYCKKSTDKEMLSVVIYSIQGDLIKKIHDSDVLGNSQTIVWNCTDSNSQQVNAGIYIVKIEIRNEHSNIKVFKTAFTIMY